MDGRVLKALSLPLVEHLDPYFIQIMDETVELLRYAFKTKNKITLPISGTGSAGMESAVCNLIEAGEKVVVCINGYFGDRLSEMIKRCGGKPLEARAPWGKAVNAEDVEQALSKSGAEIVAVVHGETSTGLMQPLQEISKVAAKYNALFLVDAVTTLGGCELDVDGYGIDLCYSASQKCLSSPPGLSPITASERAMDKVRNRKEKVFSWYLDLSLLEEYWIESGRVYHHTAPISLNYALREGLRLVYEEGLEARWLRHRRNSEALIKGVEALGLKMHVEEGHRCPSLNAILVPEGINDADLRKILREEFHITVSGGLGDLKGKVLRVGLMGLNSSERNVILFLEALERALAKKGYQVKAGTGVGAAIEAYR